MKNNLFIILISILIINCKNDTIFKLNTLEKYSDIRTQIFKLDTITTAEIKAKNGTIIYYNRKDLDIFENEKITLEVKEFYDFKELVLNNINTLTDKNELLESSGVIYVNFKSKNRQVFLKPKSYLKIKTPKILNNDIFIAKIDTLNQFKWSKLKSEHKAITQKMSVATQNGSRIEIDTIGYYNTGDYYKLGKLKDTLMINKLGFINFDKIIKNSYEMSFNIEVDDNNIEILNSLIIYNNYNSFISNYHTRTPLHFNNIPVIKNKTSIIIIGFKNEQLFASKIKLTNSKLLKMKLKKTTINEFKEMIK